VFICVWFVFVCVFAYERCAHKCLVYECGLCVCGLSLCVHL